MADDPLSIFRRKPVEPKPPVASAIRPPAPALVVNHAGGREVYEPFHCQDRVPSLHIRGKGFGHAIPYHCIANVTYDPDTYRRIIITASHMLITIMGRNLRGIADALSLNTCHIIQEFRPEKFIEPQPGDQAAPLVEKITVDIMNPNIRSIVEREDH